VPSEHTAQGVADRTSQPVRVVGLGFNAPAASIVTEAAPRSETEVLYAGRFDEAKGTADFLTAAAYVAEHHPEATFALAGGIPGNPSAERRWKRRFEDKAPASLVARVRFLGWLSPDALRDALAHAAVVVLPSWQETFGLTALEAMGQAAPIVAARGGAIVELLEHQESALLTGARLPVALADAVLTLLRDPKHGASLGAKACEIALASWRWNTVIGDWVSAYGEPVAATDE
jgi:glycosyltransferase involved in cell wall biosynthesis